MTTQDAPKPEEEVLELARFLIASLLPEGTEFDLKARDRRGATQIVIRAPESHRGAIIGKGGSIARALRQVVSAGQFDESIRNIDIEIAED